MGGGACFATPFVPEHEGKLQLQKKKNFAYLHTFRPEGAAQATHREGSTEMRWRRMRASAKGEGGGDEQPTDVLYPFRN